MYPRNQGDGYINIGAGSQINGAVNGEIENVFSGEYAVTTGTGHAIFTSAPTRKPDDKDNKYYLLKMIEYSKGITSVEFDEEYESCIICETNKKNIIFLPCGHVSLCSECMVKMASKSLTNYLTNTGDGMFQCADCGHIVKKINKAFI